MHVTDKDKTPALKGDHGEIIYELVGRNVGENTDMHSVAVVVLPLGKSSILRYHQKSEECYFRRRGKALLCLGDVQKTIKGGQIVSIRPNTLHKICNIGSDDLEFLAICVPAWEPNNTEFLE